MTTMLAPRDLDLFEYERWPSRLDESWGEADRSSPYDQIDFHVDLGCGRLPKARIGVDRYPAPGVAVMADLETGVVNGIPREPGQDALVDGKLWTGARCSDTGKRLHEYEYKAGQGYQWPSAYNPANQRLPFHDSSIESIVSHHFFEHMGDGFIPLIDDIYRVLKPGGILRAITPLFPSWSAVQDPDHRRYFLADENAGQPVSTWTPFCGTPDNCWLDSFSVPYTTARFELLDQDYTARSPNPGDWWTARDARELRVALKAVK